MQMEMSMMDNGLTTKPMGSEFIYIEMELYMKAIGLIIFNKVME
jgi:hypothetical protein